MRLAGVGWQSSPEHLQEQTSHHLSGPSFPCFTTSWWGKKFPSGKILMTIPHVATSIHHLRFSCCTPARRGYHAMWVRERCSPRCPFPAAPLLLLTPMVLLHRPGQPPSQNGPVPCRGDGWLVGALALMVGPGLQVLCIPAALALPAPQGLRAQCRGEHGGLRGQHGKWKRAETGKALEQPLQTEETSIHSRQRPKA